MVKIALGTGSVKKIANTCTVQKIIGHQAVVNTSYGDVVEAGLFWLGGDAVGTAGADTVNFQKERYVLTGDKRGQYVVCR